MIARIHSLGCHLRCGRSEGASVGGDGIRHHDHPRAASDSQGWPYIKAKARGIDFDAISEATVIFEGR